MKDYVRAVSLVGLLSLITAWTIIGTGPSELRDARASSAADQKEEESGGLPPLVVDKDAPLLLEEAPKTAKGSTGRVADNSACYVCHENYRKEALVQWHGSQDIGCVDCHGPSFAHRNDENNITPPDVLFPLEKIDRACEECHHSHDASAQEVLARFSERCPEKTDPKKVVCTDCHGQHRLKSRTVRWDKKTGKLIKSE